MKTPQPLCLLFFTTPFSEPSFTWELRRHKELGVEHASGTGPYMALKALRMGLLFKVNKQQTRKWKGLWNSITHAIVKLNGTLSTANLVYLICFLHLCNSSYWLFLFFFFFLPFLFLSFSLLLLPAAPPLFCFSVSKTVGRVILMLAC